MKRQSRPPTPEEQAFYAGFTGGGVLKISERHAPGGVHDLLRTLERFAQYLADHPRDDTMEVYAATHNLIEILRRDLS